MDYFYRGVYYLAMTIALPHEAAEAMGFPPMTHVSTLLSISHLFGTSKKRCGIYFLAFPADLFYIGQAIDVVRRFSQHRQNYDDIIGFSFMPVAQTKLDDVEKELIFKADKMFKLRNKVHVSSVIGDADFDLVMPRTEQEAWLSATSRLSADADAGLAKIILPESQQVRFLKNFEQFTKHPLAQKAQALLAQYIRACIPAPRRTEYSFWSVSCTPSTNKSTWPRLFCVNAASMELFVVGWEKGSDLLWSFLTVDKDKLAEYWPKKRFLKKFPFVELSNEKDKKYRDAGQNQITLRCDGTRMARLLSDSSICKAAAALNLRVMRKRANLYAQYHCSQLVNQALSIRTNN